MAELTYLLFQLFIIIAAAKLTGEIFERLRQPPVVGELLIGMLMGPHALGWIQDSHVIHLLSEIAVIFLLFQVGLESRLSDMLRVGRTSFWVALLGVVFPFLAGVAFVEVHHHDLETALFVGAAMVATSVGITARVLADLKYLQSQQSRIILGAAVIDDVLGMLVLALVVSLTQGEFSWWNLAWISLQAALFILVTVVGGSLLVRRLSPYLRRFKARNFPVIAAVLTCFGLAALAQAIGLAAIIGAFLAGMIFAENQHEYELEHKLAPLTDLLVPIFFVIVGAGVDVRLFGESTILLLALILTALALATKLLGCGLAALKDGWHSALIVGLGMTPRGEVGLIIASIGASMKIIPPDLYAVIVAMCMATTLFMPPFMKWAVESRTRHGLRSAGPAGGPDAPPAP